MIAVHFGGTLKQAKQIIHGKASQVRHDREGVFRDLSNPLWTGRYHSLAVDPENLPSELIVTAKTDDGEIMGLRHRELPIEAVQFHPESILTPEGDRLIRNFIESAARYQLALAQ
jgi:anthranilate synthase/aminodeoxychorismate synthase-like glutamine amidotransferase